MTAPFRKRPFDWEASGRSLGETLGEYHAIIVTGSDPVTTARAAIGIARAQSMYRRVAIGDLFAESPPIQALVTSDDPHGLVDSFLYGVSLSRIAYPVEGPGELYVMQSGTEPPDYETLLPNPRWHRLTAGFREVGALLVLAVPASAPRIEDLVKAMDGAVLVGEGVPRRMPVSCVIASLRDGNAVAAAAAAEAAHSAIIGLAAELGSPTDPREKRSWSKRRIASISGVVLTLVLAGVAAWLGYRPLAQHEHRNIGPKPDTTRGISAVIAAVGPDTAVRDAAADSAALAAAVAVQKPLTVRNPEDSGNAAAYGVELMEANTQSGAILKLQQDGKLIPAATFAPVLVQGATWYPVISGAYTSRAGADSLLSELRRRKVLDHDKGAVVRLPYSFLIESEIPATAVTNMLAAYADRGEPVYALRQADGSAWLLAGAFESIEQAALYAESLRASAISPVLVYRKGRMF